jgi:ribonuclease HII
LISAHGALFFRTMPLLPSLQIEQALWASGVTNVAGVDEAGRGCLAGPVVAAAVIFPPGCTIDGVDDSKKLTEAERDERAQLIREKAAGIAVGICSPAEIDRLNILWASMEAMRRAVASLTPDPQHLLIDGNHCFPDSPWPFDTVIRGDSKSLSVAAASIVAKTARDRLMRDLHVRFPGYGWVTNVGYPTPEHYRALVRLGPTPYHRRSFRLGGSAAGPAV